MKSSDILLSIGGGHRLEVFKVENFIAVLYEGAEIKDGLVLATRYGTGLDFESACDDYLSKIRGKRLVFNACKENRHELICL